MQLSNNSATLTLLHVQSSWFEGSKAWICGEINWYNTIPRLWGSSAWSCMHVWYSGAAWRSLQNGLEAGVCWSWKWHPPRWGWPLGVSSCLPLLFGAILTKIFFETCSSADDLKIPTFREFVSCVKSIKILSSAEVQQMSLDGDLGCIPPQGQACSASDDANAWRGWCKY